MSEPMQAPGPRPPRAERTTTSCGECRRRKQKCNQGQPCSNCARRFPQPLCEYKPSIRCVWSKFPPAPQAGTEDLADPGRDRRPSAVGFPQRPAFAVSPSPSAHARSGGFNPEALRQPPISQPSPLFPPWNPQPQNSEDVGDLLWPGFDFFGQSPTPTLTAQHAWSADQQSLFTSIIGCEEGCTSHSEDVHDAIRILHAYRPGQSQWAGNSWAPASAWTLVPAMSFGTSGLSWPGADLAQDLVSAPVVRVMPNSELLIIFIKFMSQFTASLDGNPEASNPYIKHYAPYCLNSQLLAQVATYSAACFLTDSGHVERTVAMAHKGHVIKLLNEHIRSQLSASDEVIAGVVQLILAEWLWGNTNDLRAHLRGLREMIRFRGGFRMLGLHGLISKLAISLDVAVALSFEISSFLREGPEFDFRDNSQIPLRIALNTPLISSLVAFSSCDTALRIHPAVASILDDMRFLLAAVLALPESPSAKELQKVHTTSAWIHERISSLPEDSPAARRPSATSSPFASRASSAMPEASSEDQQHPLAGRGNPRPQQHQHHQQKQPRRASAQSLSLEHPRVPSRSPPPPGPATPAASAGQPGPADPRPDYVYQAVRQAALLYSRAIMQRRPFSMVVAPAEFLQLWTTAWRVPLSTWRSLLGVLNWILLPIVSCGKAAAAQPHDRFVKGMMNISLFQMGMDNWEIASAVMEAGLSLQRWLAGGWAARQANSSYP
ncbi:oleate activated transcription factor 3 [Staphylotrichum tortipilum]|uniref:Oleate activated transcription factor 3 n=1 Tax=Staphylotrichum tortipilum TaxID=2831512 RepID=A0AAN6RTM0_9PEZI|nr:oleate activated transcription factor 3 [Staphylotrichum longicolle]